MSGPGGILLTFETGKCWGQQGYPVVNFLSDLCKYGKIEAEMNVFVLDDAQ